MNSFNQIFLYDNVILLERIAPEYCYEREVRSLMRSIHNKVHSEQNVYNLNNFLFV